MKARLILLASTALVLLSFIASAERCEDISTNNIFPDCFGHSPPCNAKERLFEWRFWDPKGWDCFTCPSVAGCYDYTIKDSCERDPCKALQNESCIWDILGDDMGLCLAPCTNVPSSFLYSSTNMRSCTDLKCLYDSLFTFYCTECPRDLKCSDYGSWMDILNVDDRKYQCEKDPCNVPGKCGWDADEGKCVEDMDGDGKLGEKDNCPQIYNPDQNNTYCHKPPSQIYKNGKCQPDSGDACDDTDGDGVLDMQEFSYNTSPIDVDTDDNCITDGVEFMFQPIINILNKMAIAVATVMLMYVGLKWVTSEEESGRANAKAAVVYILVGLLILLGGKNMVIFILQTKCPPQETPKMVVDTDFWWCPGNCSGNATIPPPPPFSSIALLLSPDVINPLLHQADGVNTHSAERTKRGIT